MLLQQFTWQLISTCVNAPVVQYILFYFKLYPR